MKKIFTMLSIFVFAFANTQAQSIIGLRSDDYNGVLGVGINPANAVSSKYRMDLNLIGVSASMGTDFLPVNLNDLQSFDINSSTQDINNAFVNVETFAPSVLIGLGEKSGIAISIKNRTFVRATDISKSLFDFVDAMEDPTSLTGPQTFNLNLDIMSQMYNEIAFTYARSVIKNENHTLNVGATFKLLQNVGDFWLKAKDLQIKADEQNVEFTTTGKFAAGYPDVFSGDINASQVFDSYLDNISNFGSFSYGFDLGVSYQFKPNGHERAYKFKVDAAIVDIGKIKSNNAAKLLESPTEFDVIAANSNINDLADVDLKDINNLDLLFANKTNLDSYDISLPRTLNLNVDYNVVSKFYIAAWASLDMLSDDTDISSPHTINTYAIVPRWEAKYFGLSLPYVMNELGNSNIGIGMRLGPIYVGSGSIISTLISNEVYNADVYFGARIPIYRKKAKVVSEEENQEVQL